MIRLAFDGGQSCHLGVISDSLRCVLIDLDTTTTSSWPGLVPARLHTARPEPAEGDGRATLLTFVTFALSHN